MTEELKVNRPEPIVEKVEMESFKKGSNVPQTLKALDAGKFILIKEYFSDGLFLLNEVHKYIGRNMPNKTFHEQQDYRSKYQEMSNRVLIQVENNTLVVAKSPKIGWLDKLYPDIGDFYLTLPQVQGLNSSWQWYKKGVIVPVLRNKIHPYYGIYFPTRFEHLELFDNWLKRYEGPKKNAIDVGFGSGVLSLQMVKHGFQKVFGTDINPNAVIGLKEFMGETKLSRKIELDLGAYFGKWTKPADLIVFNPPWLPAVTTLGKTDPAIYYDADLFSTFFEKAKDMLLPDGKLVLIFSNLGNLTKLITEHPIENEIATGGRFKLDNCYTKKVKLSSNLTKRDQHWRSEEKVELWELSKV